MSHVILNGAPYGGIEHAASWGDLLDAIDRDTAATGAIVGTVRFDGVDEPGFREPAILIRPLESDLIVEVETEAPAALLGRILDEGVESLPALEQSARALADAFRGPDVMQASRGLVQLAESLINLVTLIAASTAAAGARLDALTLDGQPVGAFLTALDTAIGPLLEAHAASDYITVADALEYDVAPAIPQLRDVIEALREAVVAN
jgi:hypothetical protein